MKQLYNLLLNIEVTETLNYKNSLINKLSFNSRDNLDNAIFFAIQGVNADGHNYIEQAIDKGAVAIVAEKLPTALNPNVSYILVKDSNYALGIIASVFYDKPSDFVKVIGITGTNGKTTTATLLYKLLMKMGYNVGLISTVAIYINEENFDTTHTTPDQITLQYYLNLMESKGCEYCIMEVSSHSVVQNRIAGINFFGGIFTNITRDHLDYHKTFDNYLQAKKLFFDNLEANAFALSNKDDNHGMYVLQNTKAKQFLYSLNSISDFRFKVLENTVDGMLLNIDNIDFYSKLSGIFNAYNLLAVYAVCRILDKDKNNVLKYLSALEPVQGRFEKVISNKNKVAVVDYAHTPDAVSNILESINATKGGNQNLITVIGCGGNRDKGKRPEMAKIACEKSNKVIFTSDNPRFENPEDIINDMVSGIKNLGLDNKYITILDRREAIKTACLLSGENDIILVAGKGHETYQEINGIKHNFNDKEVLKEFINL